MIVNKKMITTKKTNNQNKYETFDNKYLGEMIDTWNNHKFVVVQIAEDEVYFRNVTSTGSDFYVSLYDYKRIVNDPLSRFQEVS